MYDFFTPPAMAGERVVGEADSTDASLRIPNRQRTVSYALRQAIGSEVFRLATPLSRLNSLFRLATHGVLAFGSARRIGTPQGRLPLNPTQKNIYLSPM